MEKLTPQFIELHYVGIIVQDIIKCRCKLYKIALESGKTWNYGNLKI